MQKVRVYQLAKELNVQSALILELLDRLGADVKSDLSVLDGNTANLVRKKVTHAIEAEKQKILEEQKAAEQAEREKVTAAKPAPAATTAAEEPEAPATDVEAPAAKPAAEEPEQPAAAAAAPSESEEPSEPAAPERKAPAAAAPADTAGVRVAKRREAPRTPPATKPPTAPSAPGPPAPPSTSGAPRRRVFRAQRIPTPAELAAQQAGRGGRPGGYQPGGPPGGNLPPRVGPGGHHRPGGRPAPGRPAPPKRRRKKRERRADIEAAPPPSARPRAELPPVPKEIALSEGVTVKELGEKLNRKSKDVIAKLLARGVLATINQPLDPEVAINVAKDFGCEEARVLTFEEEAAASATPSAPAADEPTIEAEDDTDADTEARPPVVTVMGHVDHGKTSLLDAIRSANIVDGEAGGITQHIGAYQVEENGRKITFLDTPGHEAFTMMRARGAKATDIVVLVVAADDGVKPQTREAIDHAKAAKVPIVVAINKIDKPNARVDRVKQQLMEHELVIEEYGGDIVACEVSAKQRTGLDNLLEMILLTTDIQELRAKSGRAASGTVLEARLDRARGVLATVLVQDGTLKTGDSFIAGSAYGKVRAMTDAYGNRVDEAGPSVPVEVMGWAEEPQAGDQFQAIADEAKARQIASFRQEKTKEARQRVSARTSLEDFAAGIGEGVSKELRVLIKGDVHGSLEALEKALNDLPSEKIRVNVLRTSIGAITQADVLLATASDALIIGFNVRPDRQAADLAKREGVEIRLYTVIYDLLDDVKQAMLGMLEPTLKETVLGQAEVRQPFKIPKIGQIAGSYVTDGTVKRNAEVRLLRDNVVVYTGKVGSLRRFKEDVAEVNSGYECGIGIANYNDIKAGDVLEFFVTEKVAQETL